MAVTMLTVALLTNGCTSSSEKVVSTLTVPTLPPPKTVGSLWQEENGRAYLYEDMRAMRVGDILTIKIVENHKGSKSADTSAERDSTIQNSLAGTAIGYIGIPGIRLGGEARRGLGIDASASNKFGGKGATNREGTLTGTISVIVTEVLPNGDLRVEGRREVTVNSEKQMMTIAGLVRRVDVDTKNTVLSSAIADAKIVYSGLGVSGRCPASRMAREGARLGLPILMVKEVGLMKYAMRGTRGIRWGRWRRRMVMRSLELLVTNGVIRRAEVDPPSKS